MAEGTQPRQLIVCCDGTNNNVTGGRTDTNVVKFLQWLGGPQSDQVVFYDPGVGNVATLPGTGLWDSTARFSERVAGLALGRGVYENVADAYSFLMREYREGDQIYFFGFSRGAFTARSAAGMVNQFGLLQPHMTNLLTTLVHVYFSSRKGSDEAIVKGITEEIRANFVDAARMPKIHFVGVWDTVASVGMWPFEAKMTARPTIKAKQFVHVRQALALDEHRVPFKPRLYIDNSEEIGPDQSVEQRWFRGAHCDAGGGYAPERSAISNEALAWMILEAKQCGLRLDSSRVRAEVRQNVVQALNPGLFGKPPIVHSETYYNCLWAVAGLTVRHTDEVAIDDSAPVKVKAKEHESVVETPLSFPKDTVWSRSKLHDPHDGKARGRWIFPLVLLAALLLYGLEGYALGARGPDWWRQIAAMNNAFAQWQLTWWLDGAGACATLGTFGGPVDPGTCAICGAFAHPVMAVLLDFLYILAYAYLLSWFAVRAFARIVKFNRVNKPCAAFVSVLGRAMPVLVVSDVAENLLTLLVMWLARTDCNLLCSLVGALMSVASAGKFVGLVGVLLLIAWGGVAGGGSEAGNEATKTRAVA